MKHRAPRDTGTGRTRLGWWSASAVCAVAGLALILGSCSSTTSAPPQPPASAAGSLTEPVAPAASSPAADPTGPSSSASSTSSRSAAAPSPSSTSSRATTAPRTTTPKTTATGRSTTPAPSAAPPRSSVALPTFENQVTGPVLAASPPVSLTIPAIGVSASPVMSLGLAQDGTVEVPPLEDTKSSGWYRGSPTPGQLGPSILLGHVDSARSGPSVFYKLGDLRPGDEVDVTRADGTVAVFRVDAVREYPKTAFPTKTVYGNINHAGLRLITCGGAFNPSVGHYESNVIAFATLVSSRRA